MGYISQQLFLCFFIWGEGGGASCVSTEEWPENAETTNNKLEVSA